MLAVNLPFQRFAISIPAQMAASIDAACKMDGRNRSEFFREAVRFYMNAGRVVQAPSFVLPSAEQEKIAANRDDPFASFSEWSDAADDVYDSLR